MLKQILIATALFTATAVATPHAHAGAKDKEKAVEALHGLLTNVLIWMREKTWSEGETGLDRYLAQPSCMGLIADAKKAGMTDADKLVGYYEHHPKAVKLGVNKYEITLADAAWLCGEWDKRLATEPAAIYIRRAAVHQKNNPNEPTTNDAGSYSKGAGEATAKRGAQCIAAIDKLVASGTPDSDKVTLDDGSTVTLAEGKKLCQRQQDWGNAFEARIGEVRAAKRAEIAAKYEALGVKGDRLELFIEYDGVYFRGKKCEIIDDIKKLAKAKYVYQWLENSDYTHTIRKYTFKGNKYKVSEKTYTTEAKAYKGCK